jgi:predicted nuclease of predicted toxin-antitoxin system
MNPPLIANENFPAPSIRYLRDRGCDVVSVGEQGGELADEKVLERAVREARWIVTFDRDYGELIFARGLAAPPAVVLFRLKSYRPEDPGRILADLLDSGAKLEGYFSLVEETGVRMRPLPQEKPARG